MENINEVIDIASRSTVVEEGIDINEFIDIASTSTVVEEVFDIKSTSVEDEEPLSEKDKYLKTQIEYSKSLTELLKTLSGDGSSECCCCQFIRDILETLMKVISDIEKQFSVYF